MTLKLQLPEKQVLKPRITVFGVGGAGGNAVNNMILSELEGVQFVVANTDAQALEHSLADNRVQLGEGTTKGLGAGAMPEVGRNAAEEALEKIKEHMRDVNMVFITAGMGGGTGTGAAPVIAKTARDLGILTVGVVTKPFHFEGAKRMRVAEAGLKELQQYVDTLIVIPNQNLFRVANERTTFADAFRMADDVLHSGVRGITDLMIMPGLINLDFADIRTVMGEMGKAMMGTGEAEGDNRAIQAAEAAISNPLLDNVSMQGARGVLISITGGSDLTLFEVDEAANRIREEVDPEANIIFGSTFNGALEGKIRVSVVATGIDGAPLAEKNKPQEVRAEEEDASEAQEQEEKARAASVAFEKIKAEIEGSIGGENKAVSEAAKRLDEEYRRARKQEEDAADTGGKRVFMAPPAEKADILGSRYGEGNADAPRGGFFSRVIRVATRSLYSEPREEETPKAKEEAKQLELVGAEVERSSKKPTQEDLLDVPAFLRRK